jgi:hypothetical protein
LSNLLHTLEYRLLIIVKQFEVEKKEGRWEIEEGEK